MIDRIFEHGGEMGVLMQAADWSATPLGPPERWPQALRTTVGLLLRNHSPMLLWWGEDLVQLYNDAYRPVLGNKHPRSMGQSVSECWKEVFHIIGPMIERPFRGGPASTSDDLAVLINRKGFSEEAHFRVAYSPVPDETIPGTGVGGVLATVTETTEQVYAERQLRTLRELAAHAAEANTAERACQIAAETFRQNDADVPFALFYLASDDGRSARLVSQVGFSGEKSKAAPETLSLADDRGQAWPIAAMFRGGAPALVDDLQQRFDTLPPGAWSQMPNAALALPLASPDQPAPYGVLITGLSPHRAFDTGYRAFIELASAQVVTAIRNATAYQAERRRAEQLAEVDRAKTLFFSNVSHEFRTPLTLMLGPLEDALADARHPLPAAQRDRAELAHRNGMRLHRLVNSLLNFSRIEAGRAQAAFAPTELGPLTCDLASSFRSAIERAGLKLAVDVEQLPEPIWVDPSMWEKIVLNLVSNAFKFTLEGEVRVSLKARGDGVSLTVADTGIGIPAAELPRIFERFHRVEGAKGRSHEGSGIGLAMVNELVKLHGGAAAVRSEPGKGTAFEVTLPKGFAHLPKEQVRAQPRAMPGSSAVAAFLAEASQWTGSSTQEPLPAGTPGPERILVVDDNADMRSYVARLLKEHWQVETACDGVEALERVGARVPDLVLSDVMMPRLDGVGLLQKLRAAPRTQAVPIVLLSARAGEEAIIEGLNSGADEYLVKPFSAAELVARVKAQLAVSKLRQEAARAAHEHALQATRLLTEAQRAVKARDEMVAVVSHDLRSPLTVVDHSAQILKRLLDRMAPGDANEKLRRHADNIRDAAGRMNRLIGDLLDAESIDSGTFGIDPFPQDVGALALACMEAFQAQATQKGVRLMAEIEPGLPEVPADRDRLGQVLSNLLSNALKFTDAGSVGVAVRRARNGVTVCVEDTGCGIAPEALPRVFERHWRKDPKRRGSYGLGLAIAKGIVEAHGGGIRVESAPGKGSCFTLTLPQTLEVAVERPEPAKAEPVAGAGGAHESFVAMASHELRTPLTALRVHLEALLKLVQRGGAVTPARATAKLHAAVRQVDRLTRLSEVLLDASSLAAGPLELERERVDSKDLLERVIRRVERDAKAVDATFTLTAERVEGPWDRERLDHVFSSLVTNALKYAPRARIDVTVQRERTGATVVVRDPGPGMREEGLGLHMAKEIVSAHGGRIDVDSAPDCGSAFTVHLPLEVQ